MTSHLNHLLLPRCHHLFVRVRVLRADQWTGNRTRSTLRTPLNQGIALRTVGQPAICTFCHSLGGTVHARPRCDLCSRRTGSRRLRNRLHLRTTKLIDSVCTDLDDRIHSNKSFYISLTKVTSILRPLKEPQPPPQSYSVTAEAQTSSRRGTYPHHDFDSPLPLTHQSPRN